MSFQSLISGSECATPANPLSQVLKHTEADRSIQQDRFAGPSSSRLHHLPGTSPSVATGQDLALARQFFEAGNGVPTFSPSVIQELSSPQLKEAWVSDQQHHMRMFESNQAPTPQWATEFDGRAIRQMQEAATSDPHQMASFRPQAGMHASYMPHPGMFMAGPPLMQNFSASIADLGKGKGKAREADFEAAFAQVAASFPQESGTSRIIEVEHGVTDIDEALKSTRLQDSTAGTDFRSRVWDQLQNSDAPPPAEDLAKWEAEFNQLMDAQRDDLNYGNAMKEAWESGLGNLNEPPASADQAMKFDNDGLPILGDYLFEKNNKYLDPSNSISSPLSDAKALLEQNGALSEASLLLEAAIQKGDLGEGGYEAWILLGETKNMDEHEEEGMRALTEGVRRAEAAGASGAGMMSLAISFTNESMDRASHVMLLRWLRARFPDLPVSEETIKSTSTNSSWDTHTKITDLYLTLARQQHSQGIVDSDVQIGLGVLYYTNGDYSLAKDCFESALSQRPRDYLLWNRLGSSLSNGNKPEEALGAYREALQLRPTYTRAIYNVGVACLNIGAHKEAAEHFLSALALQERTSGDTSDQLWFTLRRAFIAMDRADLAEHAKRGSKGSWDLFRKEGFDF